MAETWQVAGGERVVQARWRWPGSTTDIPRLKPLELTRGGITTGDEGHANTDVIEVVGGLLWHPKHWGIIWYSADLGTCWGPLGQSDFKPLVSTPPSLRNGHFLRRWWRGSQWTDWMVDSRGGKLWGQLPPLVSRSALPVALSIAIPC